MMLSLCSPAEQLVMCKMLHHFLRDRRSPCQLQNTPHPLATAELTQHYAELQFQPMSPQLRVKIHNGVKTNYLICCFLVEDY